ASPCEHSGCRRQCSPVPPPCLQAARVHRRTVAVAVANAARSRLAAHLTREPSHAGRAAQFAARVRGAARLSHDTPHSSTLLLTRSLPSAVLLRYTATSRPCGGTGSSGSC